MKIWHMREKRKVKKNSKTHTNFFVHKKWEIYFLSLLNTSFKRGEIKLIWLQISNCSDLHIHWMACFTSSQASSISGTYFFPFWIFKLEALSDCISVPWASRHSNCGISISILLRTKGGTSKLYPPVQIPASHLNKTPTLAPELKPPIALYISLPSAFWSLLLANR